MLVEAVYGLNPEQGPVARYIPTGKGFAFDLGTSMETPMQAAVIPMDYWPHQAHA